MFQMIWWHLLLSMLCAHAAFPSTSDAIAAFELLHQSQVKVTIKTGAQILCSLSAFCHTVQKNSSGCGYRKQIITSHVPEVRDFLPQQKGQNAQREMQRFWESLIHQFVTTWSQY